MLAQLIVPRDELRVVSANVLVHEDLLLVAAAAATDARFLSRSSRLLLVGSVTKRHGNKLLLERPSFQLSKSARLQLKEHPVSLRRRRQSFANYPTLRFDDPASGCMSGDRLFERDLSMATNFAPCVAC